MKTRLILSLGMLLGLAGCAEGDSPTSSVSSVPDGGHWMITLDGASPYDGTTLVKAHASGSLHLMGSFGPGGSGVLLAIPMATEYETGTFKTGVALEMPGVPGYGHCEHEADSSTSNVTVKITQNTKQLFVSTFEFVDLYCRKAPDKISGSGVITKKKVLKK